MGATTDRREGEGQSTLKACAQPLAVEFLLLLFFAQIKEKKGTPQRAKSSPPEVSTSGGLLYKLTNASNTRREVASLR